MTTAVLLTGECASLVSGDGTQMLEIILVANEHNNNVGISMVTQLSQPTLDVLKCQMLRDVIHDQCTDCTAVVAAMSTENYCELKPIILYIFKTDLCTLVWYDGVLSVFTPRRRDTTCFFSAKRTTELEINQLTDKTDTICTILNPPHQVSVPIQQKKCTFTACQEPYSLVLISGLPGRQTTGDLSNKSSNRLPLPSARPDRYKCHTTSNVSPFIMKQYKDYVFLCNINSI